VSYQYRAVEKFWRNFYRLSPLQKESVRRAWQKFKSDPFHPALASHDIHELSAKARHRPEIYVRRGVLIRTTVPSL
jgi:hypothetical protein